MPRRTVIASLVNCFILLSIACSTLAQQAGQGAAPAERRRPGPAPLFFREDWKTVPGLPVEHLVSQAAIATPNLELKLYGAASKDIQENGAPNRVWTRGNLLENVDLSKVDEVGFADLIPGSGHGDGGYVDVGWVEVYGKPVKRDAATSSLR